MQSPLFRSLRVIVIFFLVVLSIQFEFGMAVNLSPNLTDQPPFAFSLPQIYQTLQTVGLVAIIHATTGFFLLLLAIVNLVLALRTRVRGVQVFGILGFVSVLMAVATGILFTLSGFQNDGYSHGMATNFLLTFIFYFIELYLLKPAPVTN